MILIDFYDSTEPAYMPVGSLAACYGFGPFAVNTARLARFHGHILISDVPENLALAARLCRVLDIERGAAGPGNVAQFVNERRAWGHDDATIYASLSAIPAILDAAPAAVVGPYRLWVAWWERPDVPTPTDICNELEDTYRTTLDPARVWAVQYANRRHYDISRCYGTDDFVR